MKTILIPTNKMAPLDLCDKLESIGLFRLTRNEKGRATAFKYIEGISSKPSFPWEGYNDDQSIDYHRIKLTEQGINMLIENKINFKEEK